MRTTLARLARILDPRERRNALVLLALMGVGAAFEVVGVGAIPAFVGVVTAPDVLLEIEPVRASFAAVGVSDPEGMMLAAALGLIVLFAVKNLYLAGLAYAQARYSARRRASLSNRLFRAYLRAPYPVHLGRNTAELLRNTNAEAGAIAGGVILPVLRIAMEAMVLVLIGVLLAAVEPLVTAAVCGVFGALSVVFYKSVRARIVRLAAEEQDWKRVSFQSVQQGLGGLKDARVLGREGYFERAFRESTDARAHVEQFKVLVGALPRLVLETTAVTAMLAVSAILVAQDRPTATIVPTLTLLGVAVVRMMPSFQKISANLQALKWGERSLAVVYDDLVGLHADAARPDDAGPLPFERELRLEGVRYRYPGQAGEALRGVSLTVPKGASVGFVGASGAGKTTLVDVVLGLLAPTAGRVLVDGVDVADRLGAWRRKIGYIPQSIYLTDDTVRRNVAFGVDDAEIDDAAVWEALGAAQLRPFVEGLPDGLDTVVGERGARISGGQRQRVGIARALYHRPEVLVMDEATSALDGQTERQFVEALEALQRDHTVLVVAHRLSTVRDCDALCVMENGRVVARGRYDELLATSAAFRSMAGAAEAA